jgi:TPP-dependent indolepyruvate ferredoxin oxidoreductase alpha subunit
VRGVGVEWVRTVTHTYDLAQMKAALKRGADQQASPAPRSVVAQSECMLNRQRREKPLQRQAAAAASAWCASASASTPTPAPATIPASACRAARR